MFKKGTVKLKVLGGKGQVASTLQPTFPLNVINEPQVEVHRSIVAEKQELPELSYSDDDDMFDKLVHSYVHDGIDFTASGYESKLDSFSVPPPVHKIEASLACVLPELDMDPHFMGQQTSGFEQVHKPVEFLSTQRQEVCESLLPPFLSVIEDNRLHLIFLHIGEDYYLHRSSHSR
ncbi:hypothetical protein M0R45_036803 [Rubus argutus]|uniref:Uncharacterized protein n=1 Tax=Rubus argutus TaxID=59490 RepID=A0AAW1VZW2_RUBAR